MENRRKREGSYQVLDELGTLLITNFPSRSVVVPIDVPLTKTDAPMTGWVVFLGEDNAHYLSGGLSDCQANAC